MKLLITAFEPFGSRKINTSAELLQATARTGPKMGFFSYGYATLPVDFRRAWPALLRQIRIEQPDAVLLTGEKSDVHLTIEAMARNRRISTRGLTHIEPGSPDILKCSLNAQKIFGAAKTRNGFSKNFIQLSNHAGTYLCNYIYYKMLSRRNDIPTIFVHVPALEKRELAKTLRKHLRGLNIIGQELIKAIDGSGANYTSREN